MDRRWRSTAPTAAIAPSASDAAAATVSQVYINPDECVDCGACRLLCEVDAIYPDYELPVSEQKFLADNAAFFSEVLPGREAPIGSPGSASDLGAVGVDTPMVAGLPAK